MINNLIHRVENSIIWTNYLGLARSLIALSTLLSLIFNDNSFLFPIELESYQVDILNIYTILGVHYAKIFSIIVLIFVIVGIAPRYTCTIHWWITYSFSSSSMVIDGGDFIATIVTFLLIPILVLDRRKFHWNNEIQTRRFLPKAIAYFTYLLIYMQTSLIYFHASIGKFSVKEWANGTAIYYWINDTTFGLNDTFLPIINVVLSNTFILVFSTWGVLILELFLSFSIFTSNVTIKKYTLILGVLFHCIITFVHGLPSFGLIMSRLLVLYTISNNKNYDKISFNSIIIKLKFLKP